MFEKAPSQSSSQDDIEELSATQHSMASSGTIDLDWEQDVKLKDWSAQDFANIYVRLRPHLILHAGKYLREEAQAEEVVQDAFLYLMTALPELDSELGVLRFLKWKTKMLCLDIIRSSQAGLQNNMVPLPDDLPDDTQPIESLERADDAAVVRLALAKLPYRHREALLATAYLEKSISEASKDMNLSENAFRQLLFRARKSFKVALIGEAETRGLTATQILAIASRRVGKMASLVSVAVLAFAGAVQGGAYLETRLSPTQVALNEQAETSGNIQTSPGMDSRAQAQELTPEAQTEMLTGEKAKDPSDANSDASGSERSDSSTEPTKQPSEGVSEEGSEDLQVGEILGVAQSAFELASTATASENQIQGDVGSVAILPGVTASFGMNYASDAAVQFLVLEVETEGGTLVGVPTVFMESRVEDKANGTWDVEFVATDFVFGDMSGNFEFYTASLQAVAKHSVIMTLNLDTSSKSVIIKSISFKLAQRT